jgi:hypothetical protein
MFRLLTIVAAVAAALAVSAAPASAKMHLDDISLGVSASASGYVANHTEGTVSVTSGRQLTAKAKIIDGRHS